LGVRGLVPTGRLRWSFGPCMGTGLHAYAKAAFHVQPTSVGFVGVARGVSPVRLFEATYPRNFGFFGRTNRQKMKIKTAKTMPTPTLLPKAVESNSSSSTAPWATGVPTASFTAG
jgi:hypothetical protein